MLAQAAERRKPESARSKQKWLDASHRGGGRTDPCEAAAFWL